MLLRLLCMISAMFASLAPQTATAGDIRFPFRSDDYQTIRTCTSQLGSDLSRCTNCIAGAPTTIGYMNYVIFNQALRAGGLNAEIVPVESPNSERSRRMVMSGHATVRGDWDFNIDGQDSLLKTAPHIVSGTIVKGLYGLRDNPRLKTPMEAADLAQLTAAMIPTWRLDWKVLESLNLRAIEVVYSRSNMFKVIAKRGIDFTLLEFSSLPDMSQTHEGIRLLPVEGVKVALPNAQHFMVSRKAPDAAIIVEAVNRGLQVLRGNGFIDQCLVDSGVVNAMTREWTLINPDTEPLRPSDIAQ